MKKKIAFIMSTNGFSGAEQVNLTIIDSLKDKYNFVYVSRKGTINKYLEERQIEHIEINKLSVKEIKSVAEELKPDIIHATDYKASVVCSMANIDIPIISHLHNNAPWIKKVNINSIIFAVSSINYKKILTVSDSIEKEYIFSKFIKEKIINISNPLSREQINSRVSEFNVKKIYDVAFIGRINESKNPIEFVDIINELKQFKNNIRAIMIGDGRLYEKVNRYIKEKELDKNIDMVGFQKEPFKYLLEAKTMCMPSRWEGFGLVAFESLTLGIPCFASPVGGLIDIVDNSCGGLCSTHKEFVERIKECLEHREIYEQFVENAILKSKKLENMEEYMNKLDEIYREITK